MSKKKAWRPPWIAHPDISSLRLHELWLNSDGSLNNPRNYPEDLARRAIAAALERKAQKRKKAVAARARERRGGIGIEKIAQRFLRLLRAPAEAPDSITPKALSEIYNIPEATAARIIEDFAAKWETPSPNPDSARGKAQR